MDLTHRFNQPPMPAGQIHAGAVESLGLVAVRQPREDDGHVRRTRLPPCLLDQLVRGLALGAVAARIAHALAAPEDGDQLVIRIGDAGGVHLRASRALVTRLLGERANDGDGAKGTLISVDQGGSEIDVSTIAQSGSKLDLIVRSIGGEYHGELTAAGAALKGTWSQNGNAFPLDLTKKAEPASK